MKSTVVKYHKHFDKRGFELSSSLLIFDKVLQRNSAGRKIIKQFPLRVGAEAGEKLKDLRRFPKNAEKILKVVERFNQKNLQVVALGGGSIGDFAGFFASILKRGVPLTNIPSTWLAAMDSAHGGKNGLNAGGRKNQLGTFNPAQAVHIIEDLLLSQPRQRIKDAAGEFLKISLIAGQDLWQKTAAYKDLTDRDLLRVLPLAIKAKYRVVTKDPFEKQGYRQVLNLGHTLGHVIEAELKISHGEAIGQGLVFAIRWSREMKFLSEKNYHEISRAPLYELFERGLKKSLKRLSPRQVRKGLMMDKKISQTGQVFFIFVSKPGSVIRHKVKIEDILKELNRQRNLP